MLAILRRLWTDESGAIVSAEIMLVASILIIGLIVGLKSVRDSIVTELDDVSQAMSSIDHSYWYAGVQGKQFWSADSWYDNSKSSHRGRGGQQSHRGINVAAYSGGEQ